MAFSPDGRFLVSCSMNDDTVRVWDVQARAQNRALNVEGGVGGVTFSPDGQQVATGNMRASADVWDVASGRRLRRFAGDEDTSVNTVAFSPDGRLLAGGNPHVKLWDVTTGRLVARLSIGAGHHGVNRVAFSPDGKIVAAATDGFGAKSFGRGAVLLWDVSTLRRVAVLRGPAATIRAMAFNPDGKTFATNGPYPKVALWDVAARRVTATLSGHVESVSAVAFNADGTILVSASDDRSIRIWDVAARRSTAVLNGTDHPITAVAITGDGTTVAGGGGLFGDKTVRLWKVQ
ncbi:WD40 repeat domain-containing protein [Nonomuraea sp. NPDC005983]|uniref:WD40 repeat domain-containing protein n=1 Tax=Nonomuraea sp. NPDC005983 TaxID=3155595 RepID=UPI0033A006C5